MTAKRNEAALVFKDELSRKPVTCTAGRSYFVIRGDGKIYRCLYNPKVVGDMSLPELVQLSGGAMVCDWKNSHDKLVDSCHPSGDLMFATFWEGGVKNEAPWPFWSEPEDPAKAVADKAYFQVLPVMSRCNHACPYCCNFYFEADDGTIVGRPKDHDKDLALGTWTRFLETCARKLEFAHFGFLGGEPMLYSHIVPLVAEIVNERGWEVGICSNMSLTRKFREIAETIHPGKRHLVKFSASLHPSESRAFRWEVYWESVKLLKDAGFEVRATMVSWPEQTYLFEELSEKLASIGVHLRLKGCGGYEIPAIDWAYIGQHGGTSETPDYLKEIGWFAKGKDPRQKP
jgi:MoaA/NifB/PqqE/SkfB family radical SAM enzyme